MTRRFIVSVKAPSVSYARIYSVIRKIPYGRVATYGQIAQLAGIPGAARQVGYALSALPGDGDVPWHRVINAMGKISERSRVGRDAEQRAMLVEEGIEFDATGSVDLTKCRWKRGIERQAKSPRARREDRNHG